MAPFWTVWNPARSAPQVRHNSEGEARAEAERLARQQPNDSFYVMQALTVSQQITVVTTPLHPF